jgi:DNA polymerase-3 subunit gamma/tau
MAHQSLYRKYRPSTFDDVVGQSHIERTLRNAVGEGKVAHAYLFTGPRGTGKTTTARLLAKALLCERGSTGEPDGTCEQCVQVADGGHPDVFELDAASHTQVEVVRDQIIGRVQFAPARGRYKIYIIDEVHMLSASSFNALLKTLEEPPAHVVFVLCTTHPHKVPETIHSRCQRFDFHRISVEEIADHLRFISESEGFTVDKGAYTLIAKHADGGMRDAITALEQLAAFTGGEIAVDDVEGMLGEVDAAQLFEVAGLVARRDIAGCFRWIAETVETGTDLTELVRELTGHVRDLYLIAAAGGAGGFIDRTAADIALLEAQSLEFGGPDRLARVLDLLGELASELRWSSDPRLSIEVALTRMAHPHGEMTLEALAERIEALERGATARVPILSAHTSVPSAETGTEPDVKPGGPVQTRGSTESVEAAAEVMFADDPPPDVPRPERSPETHVTSGRIDRGTAKRNWQAVLAEVRKRKPAREATYAQAEIDVDVDGETLVIEFPTEPEFAMEMASTPENRELLRSAIEAVFGHAPPFRFQRGRGAVRPEEPSTPAASVPAPAPEPAESAPADPALADGDDLESVLLHELGASIVNENPTPVDGEDER